MDIRPYIILSGALLLLIHSYHRKSSELKIILLENLLVFEVFYLSYDKLQNFIENKIPITPKAFRYFLENDQNNLLANYLKIVPSNNTVQYQTLVPFHSNGISKKSIDYRDLFSLDNIILKHFTSYLHNGDTLENDKSVFKIESQNGQRENDKIKQRNFTLIYVLTVCKPTQHLIREINALSHEEVCFIIFYDNKSDRKQLYNLLSSEENNTNFSNVYFLDSPRFHVGWGQITLTFSEFIPGIAALKYFPNSMYVSFHSESDYPIVPNEVILNFLKKNYPQNYIEIYLPNELGNKANRVNYFKLYFNSRKNKPIMNMIKYLFPKKVIPDIKWRGGANWFTVTLNDYKKMIDLIMNRFELIDNMEYFYISDEIAFASFAAEVNMSNIHHYLRFIKWPGPATLNENNYNEIITAKCSLWARKFKAEESMKVLDMIDDHIKNFNALNLLEFC